MGVAMLLLFPPLAVADPVSLHVTDGDVRAVLSAMASLGHFGLVLDDSVKGRMSIDVDEAEPEDIVARIAAAKGLFLEERDGVFLLTAMGQRLYHPYTFPVHYADLTTVRDAVPWPFIRKTSGAKA